MPSIIGKLTSASRSAPELDSAQPKDKGAQINYEKKPGFTKRLARALGLRKDDPAKSAKQILSSRVPSGSDAYLKHLKETGSPQELGFMYQVGWNSAGLSEMEKGLIGAVKAMDPPPPEDVPLPHDAPPSRQAQTIPGSPPPQYTPPPIPGANASHQSLQQFTAPPADPPPPLPPGIEVKHM